MKHPTTTGDRLRYASLLLSLPLLLLGSHLLNMQTVAAQSSGAAGEQSSDYYFPDYGTEWQEREPGELGMDAGQLEEAVAFARQAESDIPYDLELFVSQTFAGEPHNEIIGPTKERGPATGMILRNGYKVAEWGEPHRVDMTFSVTKSFLSATAGLAYDQGLIKDVHDPVRHYVQDGGFDSRQNRNITWDHLLRMTSEWEGTLFGKPDWADRPDGERGRYHERELQEPGTNWKYNDVRVNRLALALLRVHREPLPAVLREQIMEPIGASRTWQWHGYENSWVRVDGQRMQSVSGGGHWGGGMFINARDMARFGLLTLNRGVWDGDRILSGEWVEKSLTPTEIQPDYGYMNWMLNTGHERLSNAPESGFYHAGAGSNIIYVDPEHDLVVVTRWISGGELDTFIGKVLEAVNE